PSSSSPAQPAAGTIVEKTVATGLDHPATFVFDRTGAIYYGERLTGEIRRIDPTTGKNTSVFTIPDVIGTLTNDQGLVGLAMTPIGGVPKDNPFKGSLVYSYGHRNSFGLAFDPKTHDLWETENGPECNDEINRIIPGRNYGWGPSENCTGTAPQDTNNSGPRP